MFTSGAFFTIPLCECMSHLLATDSAASLEVLDANSQADLWLLLDANIYLCVHSAHTKLLSRSVLRGFYGTTVNNIPARKGLQINSRRTDTLECYENNALWLECICYLVVGLSTNHLDGSYNAATQ